MANSFTQLNHKYDVIVIGGGTAGLEAAGKLYTHGIRNILLLEAHDRLGGRINTIYLDDDKTMPIEIGANWIHGIVGNPLYALVRENTDWFCQEKLELFCDDAIYCADETGKRYSSTLCYQVNDLYRQFNMDAKQYYNTNMLCPFDNYADYIRKRFEPYFRNDDPETRRVKESMVRRLLKQETTELSCTVMEECTISEYGSYLKLTGPDFEFPGGFSSLIEFLASKIPQDLIKLNCPISNISVNSNNKRIDSNSNGLKIKCENGETFYTEHVIVTCSLNFLKQTHSTFFQPGLLSKTKFDAMSSMKMGCTNKLFLVYDDLDFFPKDFNAIHPLFFNDEHYDHKSEWYLKVCTFDKFYDNVLLVWMTGTEAIHVETISEQEIANTLTKLLKKFLKDDNIPLPRKMIRTKWNSDPYARGAYSYVHANIANHKKTFDDLIEPIYVDGVPRILFAGEATHPRFYSTVHGAYLSGQREAKRLVEYFSIKTKRTQ